ncbi:type II secretion system protein XpsH [Montanilutibacter psychrotolerans]|uniref:Type II secretion system protein H n=1 Tax=Montanilutibacter psychrotolerans TaxID=1327343 RepID=A0A3M8SU55_9GAMM|nr:GspH/FimT family pseudopilin [Lysobacter psychrotolerans]RNF84323.1 prepilin-type N-terminal cleavage/methylation domain-containing protein [Lysobacter psychrotolerans]
MKRTQSGVSLMEMLLVIALIAGISVLAAGALGGGFRGMQLRSAAKEIASQLRYTRAHALATGQSQRFIIDPQAHTWEAPNGRRGEIPAALGVRFIGAREALPVRGQGAVMFFNDGAATGGRIEINADKATWRIDIAWLTGQVKVAPVRTEP